MLVPLAVCTESNCRSLIAPLVWRLASLCPPLSSPSGSLPSLARPWLPTLHSLQIAHAPFCLHHGACWVGLRPDSPSRPSHSAEEALDTAVLHESQAERLRNTNPLKPVPKLTCGSSFGRFRSNALTDITRVLMSLVPPNINIQSEMPMGVKCDVVVLRSYEMFVLRTKVHFIF